MIDIGNNTLLLAASTIGLSEFPEDVALPALIQTYIAIPGYAHTRIKIISDWSEEDIPLSAQFKTIPPLYDAWKYLHLHEAAIGTKRHGRLPSLCPAGMGWSASRA